jgi:hypothetical protein
MRPLLMHASNRTVNDSKRRVCYISNLARLHCRKKLTGLKESILIIFVSSNLN